MLLTLTSSYKINTKLIKFLHYFIGGPSMLNFLKPAQHIEPLPNDEIDETYKRLRLQVFIGAMDTADKAIPRPDLLKPSSIK